MLFLSRVIASVAVALALVSCARENSNSTFEIEDEVPAGVSSGVAKLSPRGDITPSYVAAVLSDLEAIRSEVRRDVLRTKTYTDANQASFNAIFGEPALSFQSDMWRDSAPVGTPTLVDRPGPAVYTVNNLVQAQPDCIWVKATIDETGNTKNTRKTQEIDVVLKQQPHDSAINPTPWVITQFAPEFLAIVDEERACG